MDYPITLPIRTTEPTAAQEPVTLAEAKSQCNLDAGNQSHDSDLLGIIAAARGQFEADTGIVCHTGVFTWKLTNWPCDAIEIRGLRPVTGISQITYVAVDGTTATLGSSSYALETSGIQQFIRPTYGNYWPALRGDTNGITITLVAGYASVAAIPQAIKLAVKASIKAMWLEKVQQLEEAAQMRDAYERHVARFLRSTYP